jgi:chemotaxis protein CheX
MKAEFANPFIKAVVEVFEKEADIKLTRKDLKIRNSPQPSRPISIIIGATGHVRGQVVYSMDDAFAYELTKKMLPNKLSPDLRKMLNSAVSELANMVTGRASIELAGEDHMINITPPAVCSGMDVMIDFLNIPTLALTFLSSIGELEVNIALQTDDE